MCSNDSLLYLSPTSTTQYSDNTEDVTGTDSLSFRRRRMKQRKWHTRVSHFKCLCSPYANHSLKLTQNTSRRCMKKTTSVRQRSPTLDGLNLRLPHGNLVQQWMRPKLEVAGVSKAHSGPAMIVRFQLRHSWVLPCLTPDARSSTVCHGSIFVCYFLFSCITS